MTARTPLTVTRTDTAGGVSDAVGSLLDVFPTVARLAGAPLPEQPLDGVDLWPTFTGEQASVYRNVLL